MHRGWSSLCTTMDGCIPARITPAKPPLAVGSVQCLVGPAQGPAKGWHCTRHSRHRAAGVRQRLTTLAEASAGSRSTRAWTLLSFHAPQFLAVGTELAVVLRSLFSGLTSLRMTWFCVGVSPALIWTPDPSFYFPFNALPPAITDLNPCHVLVHL